MDGAQARAFFDVAAALVGCGHVSGLLMRQVAAGPNAPCTTLAMHFFTKLIDYAKWYGELIADFETQGARSYETQMMWVARLTPKSQVSFAN